MLKQVVTISIIQNFKKESNMEHKKETLKESLVMNTHLLFTSSNEADLMLIDLDKARRARALNEAKFSLVLLICVLAVAAYCK